MIWTPRPEIGIKNPLIPDLPSNLLQQDNYNPVPLLTGVTLDDAIMTTSGTHQITPLCSALELTFFFLSL
jgi:hypothetical protein